MSIESLFKLFIYSSPSSCSISELLRQDRFLPLDSLSASGIYKSIAVPSRLYHPPPFLRQPLSGVRISIPDTMLLNGSRTLLSSRAWASLYDFQASETARYPQSLLEMGAIIVGKTKTSQFSAGEQWVDAVAPWSPRGDGYQATLGSAAGAAAALAGYEWLHYSIGQDGTCSRSIYRPYLTKTAIGQDLANANLEGLYTLRASPTSLYMNGVQISSL
jgi:hypothetical protein